jgi:cytochrome P450
VCVTIPEDPRGLVQLGARDTAALMGDVLVPLIGRGILIRRPKVVAVAQRLDLDRRAVRRLQLLRDRYGTGPLLLRLPVRRQAVVLGPHDVRRVLDETPEPFAAASNEKRSALAHFQPEGVLASTGHQRTVRRALNEAALESAQPVHHLAERFGAVLAQELGPLEAALDEGAEVSWDDFVVAWFRMVRRVVLGDAARDDHELTDALADLRAAANWAFLRPKRTGLRDAFLARLSAHVERAEPGSLAEAVVRSSSADDPDASPVQQVPQWLFAFDASAMATYRALALLATHPDQAESARTELVAAGIGGGAAGGTTLPFLRAAVLESLRLWPTTPAILRQTTTETAWDGGTLPAGTGLLVFVPFFHRDDQTLAEANRFSPELWLGQGPDRDWPLIPFSAGPATCPGRNVVLLLGSLALARLLEGRRLEVSGGGRLRPDRPLPGTLSPFGLRFRSA